MGGLVEIYWKEKEDGDNNLNARGQIAWQERLRHRRIKNRTQAAHGQHHTSGGIITVSCSSGAIVVVGSSSCNFGYGERSSGTPRMCRGSLSLQDVGRIDG